MRDEITGRFVSTNSETKQLTKKHLNDAGLDICSSVDVVIPKRGSVMIDTGLHMTVPVAHVGMVCSRSGLSVKHKLEVGAGIIDSDYRGEVKVHLYNHSDEDFHVSVGDRIAQILTIPLNLGYYEEVDTLDVTTRGGNGFGSTGK